MSNCVIYFLDTPSPYIQAVLAKWNHQISILSFVTKNFSELNVTTSKPSLTKIFSISFF